jgi:hypothetical protein
MAEDDKRFVLEIPFFATDKGLSLSGEALRHPVQSALPPGGAGITYRAL